MKIELSTKAAIVTQLNQLLNEQITLLENTISELKKSRDLETKSSAGDKYEISRARLQSEMDMNSIQLNKTRQIRNDLSQIDICKRHFEVALGSLLITTNGNYFISIGYGKVSAINNLYYAISLGSPIGQLFKGKVAGDTIKLQDNTFKILQLI